MEPLATLSHPDAGPWADADVKELTHGGMAEDEGSWYIYVCSTWELIDADSVNCGAFLLDNVWIQTGEAMCCGWRLLEVAETCRGSLRKARQKHEFMNVRFFRARYDVG